ncbi:hypothetical protein L209DRAFT_311366 [Thermothelomyces heterothallicus CBS 203.75]
MAAGTAPAGRFVQAHEAARQKQECGGKQIGCDFTTVPSNVVIPRFFPSAFGLPSCPSPPLIGQWTRQASRIPHHTLLHYYITVYITRTVHTPKHQGLYRQPLPCGGLLHSVSADMHSPAMHQSCHSVLSAGANHKVALVVECMTIHGTHALHAL